MQIDNEGNTLAYGRDSSPPEILAQGSQGRDSSRLYESRPYKKTFSEQHALVRPDLIERRIRQVSAWIVLFFMLEAELGLAWDRQWHDRLGRDQFWIPPHIMMYVGVGATGLIALFVVLIDTLRYYQQKPGVDDSSTVTVLRYFHAPLGFFLLGFGTLTDLIAAPFDNYWHQLYGVDVTLWTPFHLMGALGAIMAGLGVIYTFASEAVHEREFDSHLEPFAAAQDKLSEGSANGKSPRFFDIADHSPDGLRNRFAGQSPGLPAWTLRALKMTFPPRRLFGLNGPEWAVILLIAAFQEFVLPALTAFMLIVLGSVRLLSYPLILVAAASSCLIGVYMCIRKPGIAVLTALVVWPLSVLTEIFIPLALRFMAARLGLTWRFGFVPVFNLPLALLPLFFLICALLIEAAVYWQRRSSKGDSDSLRGAWLLGILFAVPAVFMPPAIVYLIRNFAPFITLQPDVLLVLQPDWLTMLLSLPLAMLVGAIMAFVGTILGDIWHWNKQ